MTEERSGQEQERAQGRRPLTYYDVLDLDRDATQEEIKAAYYELARQHHPDVAAESPKLTQRFALISEAYRVLSDAQRRHQYDRTLPKKTYPLRHPTPEKIWRETTDVVLIRSDRFGPLNQAMQAALPVTLDGDLLVMTIPGSERHLAGHLETASNRNAVLNALQLVYGERLDFRVIDGTTAEDWEALKKAEAKTQAPATEAAARAEEAAPTARPGLGETPWDQVMQRMHRQYQQVPKRQYPQSKARFLREAIGWIARADEELRYDAASEDDHERGVARAIERLAAILDLPAVLVAMQLHTMKRSGEV